MLKKLILVLLLASAPLQSWAASQMPFQHSSLALRVEATDASQHNCHQNTSDSYADDNHSSPQAKSCNSCALCMAFAFFYSKPEITPTSYFVSFKSRDVSFISHDLAAPIKPPIL
jgi:hypothetical protein